MLPWKETSVESERLRFIERVTAGEEPVTELCRQSGISRKTGYKLIHRYEAHGEDGLLDRSRAPHDHPNAKLAERIVEACERGAQRSSSPCTTWSRIRGRPTAPRAPLDRAGLVQRRRRRRRAGKPFAHAISNESGASTSKAGPATGGRSPHRAGRGLSLPHRLPGAGAPHRPGDAARVSARLPGVRPPPGHPHRQRPALRRRRPGQPLTPLRMVASSSGSSPSASPRDTPNRTGVSSASTAPSRRRRRRRPGPTGDDSGEPSTTSATATTTSDPTRPWDSDRRQALHPLVPALSLTPQLAGIRGRGHRAPSAPQRRDQVEGGQSLCERVSSGRAHRPRPGRAHLVDTVRTPPHRRPRRPRAADRQDPGTRVTYVPGLTVTHVPGRTEGARR